MYEGYLKVYEQEIANNNRTLAYLRNGLKWSNSVNVTSAEMCPGLDCYNYLDPATDVAPWIDSCVPESAEFAGFFIEEMTGLDNIYQGRQTTPGIGLYGGAVATGSIGVRSVTVTGWLFGKTCCAVEYGYKWLTNIIMGRTSCAVSETQGRGCMTFLDCCPDGPDDFDEKCRTMYNATLIDGPRILDRHGTCCTDCGSTALQVTFTMGVEKPWIYGCSRDTHSDLLFYGNPPESECEEVLLCASSCSQAEYDLGLPVAQEYFCCDPDEDVKEFVLPECRNNFEAPKPSLPIGCFCHPLSLRRACAELKNQCRVSDYAVDLSIYTGSLPLHNFRFAAYNKPTSQMSGAIGCPCQGQSHYWECDGKFYEILIPFVPRNHTIVISGKDETIKVIDADGREFTAGALTVQPGLGHHNRFLSLTPGQDVCIVGWAQGGPDDPTAPDATMNISATERSLVSA